MSFSDLNDAESNIQVADDVKWNSLHTQHNMKNKIFGFLGIFLHDTLYDAYYMECVLDANKNV